MEIQKEGRAARLRLIVLLPIIITFSFALALIIVSINTFFNYQLEKESNETTFRVQQAFEEHISHDIVDISNLLKLVELKPELKSAWLQKDRPLLASAGTETYEAINATFDISHFYIHSLDGKNFLRVHKPERFGDSITRKTLAESRRTGKLTAGLEIGTFGQFVLRVVKPWKINGKITGYLELGKEINHVVQELKATTNAELITIIDKSFINKADWQELSGNPFNWQKLDKWVIASSTVSTIPTLDLLTTPAPQHHNPSPSSEKKTLIASSFGLTDYSKSDVGRMVVVLDVSVRKQQLLELLTNIAIIGSVGILLISIAYFIYLGKIENRLIVANRSLYQKIGEHRLTESKLRINRDELTTINRELESYSYSIAHDLRAPLRSVTSFSQIVLEDARDRLTKDETDNLDRVIIASKRMADLIDDILQLSRITREELSKSNVNISKLVIQHKHQLSSQEPDRNVEWNIQADVSVTADPRLLERAIENLIHNAWKYTSRSHAAKITFGTLTKNNETIYFVRDNGAGFDMNYAHKLFATFQRLHSPREFTGSGVGLAIVLRVIQRHHGRIWGEGEVGKGATFYFTVPNITTLA